MASWLPPTVMLFQGKYWPPGPSGLGVGYKYVPLQACWKPEYKTSYMDNHAPNVSKTNKAKKTSEYGGTPPEWSGGESNNLREGMERVGNNVSRVRNPGCGGRVKSVNTKTHLCLILKLKGKHSVVGSMHFGKTSQMFNDMHPFIVCVLLQFPFIFSSFMLFMCKFLCC